MRRIHLQYADIFSTILLKCILYETLQYAFRFKKPHCNFYKCDLNCVQEDLIFTEKFPEVLFASDLSNVRALIALDRCSKRHSFNFKNIKTFKKFYKRT